MKIAVIGAGIVGICNAYYLARDGHSVTVFDRCSAPAQETSFAQGGISAPLLATPWSAPAGWRQLLRSLSKNAVIQFSPGMKGGYWRWLQKWLQQLNSEHYPIQQQSLVRFNTYSQRCLLELAEAHGIDFEARRGYLQLLSHKTEIATAQHLQQTLQAQQMALDLLDREAIFKQEPTLAENMPAKAAIWLPDALSGNAALFAKTLKQVCDDLGVKFQLGRVVEARHTRDKSAIDIHIGQTKQSFDAVVVAAGMGSIPLLQRLKVRLPLMGLRGYSATLPLRHPELLPNHAMTDMRHQISITPLGSHMQARLRVCSFNELVTPHAPLDTEHAQQIFEKLTRVAHEWFPYPIDYERASYWHGTCPVLPTGTPLLGATNRARVFINVGHAQLGWSLAAGSGKIVADIIAGREPAIDLAGMQFAVNG